MEEIWKDIPGFAPGTYQVSNLGNFRNMKFGYERKLNPTTALGYKVITLTKDGKQKIYKAHRLVWEAFNGPIPEGIQVNHINEIKTDNRLENLNLMTPKENINWGTRTQRSTETRSTPVRCTKEFSSIAEAARWLGIPDSNISLCCQGKIKSAGGFEWEYIKK